eukprot:CAMPEP_0117658190 /NCGR_PEP_ID=MMETSP0804-20121206/5732_1 /TAXON_ID=1074897 /ORGANISM="Tetraselmis astigmatica, Strain CCMP880" /LENGTH=245 /DNA_ID=CAMNT_0005464695 /DNA_START=110 /DNA_END=844 /DNA_ORIENTATION=+
MLGNGAWLMSLQVLQPAVAMLTLPYRVCVAFLLNEVLLENVALHFVLHKGCMVLLVVPLPKFVAALWKAQAAADVLEGCALEAHRRAHAELGELNRSNVLEIWKVPATDILRCDIACLIVAGGKQVAPPHIVVCQEVKPVIAEAVAPVVAASQDLSCGGAQWLAAALLEVMDRCSQVPWLGRPHQPRVVPHGVLALHLIWPYVSNKDSISAYLGWVRLCGTVLLVTPTGVYERVQLQADHALRTG